MYIGLNKNNIKTITYYIYIKTNVMRLLITAAAPLLSN